MLTESVARRYAKGLFRAALRGEALDTVKHELSEFVRMVEEQKESRTLWFSRGIAVEKKKSYLRKSFLSFSTLFVHFLMVLIDHHREKLLKAVLQEYEKLYLEFYNQVFVEVQSPLPVPEPIAKELKERLSSKLSKRVELVISEDPLLLGGMVLRMGDRVVDGSLRTKLEGLHEELLKR